MHRMYDLFIPVKCKQKNLTIEDMISALNCGTKNTKCILKYTLY